MATVSIGATGDFYELFHRRPAWHSLAALPFTHSITAYADVIGQFGRGPNSGLT